MVDLGVGNVSSCVHVQSAAFSTMVMNSSSQSVAATEIEDTHSFDQALLCGRHNNTEALSYLDNMLGHLHESKHTEVAEQFSKFVW